MFSRKTVLNQSACVLGSISAALSCLVRVPPREELLSRTAAGDQAYARIFLQKKATPPISKACNCRRPADYPMTGDCLKSSVFYQAAVVTTEDNKPAQTYIRLTENPFKTRFANHKSSFSESKKRLGAELSKHVVEI